MSEQNKIRAVIRIEKDGTPALFYFDEHKDLVCFTFEEGHNIASYGYYTDNTVGLNRHDDWCYYPEKIQSIKDKFQNHYDGVTLDFKLTLKRD